MNLILAALALCAAALQGQEKPAPEARRAFPRLKPPEQERLEQALFQMRSAKTAEARAEARAAVVAAGAGGVPASLRAFAKFEAERAGELRGVLDKTLAEADLDLALAESGPKAAPAARHYVVRRIADSRRDDALKHLAPLLQDADAETAFQAARGLALRDDTACVPVLHSAVRARWKDEEALLRAELAQVPRGALSAPVSGLVGVGAREDRLAGIRLFALVGVREHARVLRAALDDTDQQILLNAVNACRAVVDGEPPLERPSSPQLIEQVQLWKSKL
ncbi:MAG: hypothetical protein EYC70_16530 [Planctomycetota bacterium]|nr:MAG: hypothetical protein EYC70_16530 [Planctomycetota bacterium]